MTDRQGEVFLNSEVFEDSRALKLPTNPKPRNPVFRLV